MLKRRIQKLISIFLAVLLSGVLTAGVALADTLKGDADLLTTGEQSTVDLGSLKPGQEFSTNVLIYANGSGGYGSGAVVSLSNSTGGLSATSVTLLDSGKDKGKESIVSGTAPLDLGNYSYTVTWSTSHSKFNSNDNGNGNGNGNNSISLTFDFAVEGTPDTPPSDSTPPVLTIPADITVEATGTLTYVDIGAAIVTDESDYALTNDAPEGMMFPLGTTTVTWTATDVYSNVSTATQTVTVQDTIKPVFTFVPANITVEAIAVNTPVSIGTATATDIFDVTVTNNAPDAFPLGTTTVVWTAIDANGNENTATQTVTIVDTKAPVFTSIPDDIIVVTTGSTAQVNLMRPTATDIFDVTYSNDAPDAFPLGTTIVTWTATDISGNSVTAEQKVTVYGFSGVLSPVNAITTDQNPETAKISQYKLGSTIPVKFYITDGNGKRVEPLTATLSFMKSSTALPENAELETATSTSAATIGNNFRYDSKEGQYIFNLDSKSIQSKGLGTYIIRIQLSNGQYFDYFIAFNK